MMKKFMVITTILFVPLLLAAQGKEVLPKNGKRPSIERPKREMPSRSRSITVVGKASIDAAPDTAYVTFGVQEDADKVLDAQQNANKAIAILHKVLTSSNIDSKDIQTVEYSVRGNYDYKDGSSILKNYSARHRLKVAVNTKNLNNLLDKLAQSQPNIISDIQFDKKNKDDLYVQALKKALNNARKTAEQMAKEMNLELGSIQEIYELQAGGNPRPMGRMMMAADSAGSMVSPGQINQVAMVTVRFSLKAAK